MNNKVTRGTGIMEKYLAFWRATVADKQIPDSLRNGTILDIGCGNYPYFLNKINFKNKLGIDRINTPERINDIKIINQDIERSHILPFTDNSVEVITGLAFFEHLDEYTAKKLQCEIYRVLSPGGQLIITVPRDILDMILHIIVKVNLVSSAEVNEHKQRYTKKIVYEQLLAAGFEKVNIKVKYFELGLNILAVAIK